MNYQQQKGAYRKLAVASNSSLRAVLISPGEFKDCIVLKDLSASRTISVCFLREDSEGITDMFEGVTDIGTWKIFLSLIYRRGKKKRT